MTFVITPALTNQAPIHAPVETVTTCINTTLDLVTSTTVCPGETDVGVKLLMGCVVVPMGMNSGLEGSSVKVGVKLNFSHSNLLVCY